MNNKTFTLYSPLAFLLMIFMLLPSSTVAGMLDQDGIAPWETCALCHGLNGVSAMAKFPKLAGQKLPYLKKQTKDFHSGKRSNDGGQMSAIIGVIEESSIDSIARYFAQLPGPDKTKLPDDALLLQRYQEGKKLYASKTRVANTKSCADCHDDGAELAPHLTAQHGLYIIKQLTDFKTHARDNDGSGVMREIAGTLTDQHIQALSIFLAYSERNHRNEPRQTNPTNASKD